MSPLTAARALQFFAGVMTETAAILLEVRLDDPDNEERFVLWWDAARRLLAEQARLASAELFVLSRGHYRAVLRFPLPGTWDLVERDRRWRDLEAERPEGEMLVVPARIFRREGVPRDITTSELRRWIAERRAGRRDFVLLDVLSAQSFAKRHLPDAVNVPVRELDKARARAVIGDDLDRPVVVYCSGYG